MNEIIYKDNKIVCFSSNDFQAFVMNQDGDIESGTFSTLSALKMDRQIWIRKNSMSGFVV